ncbi:hypothetical protein [Amycolatopsis orientalis]|uniref:hypothetical protein n=1 Tax=Amycolatopsis orientalis TaxID=31958 RepID=UPI00039A1BE1|nr:hypothetical protein [Amycolatopsis orientalis]
MDRPSDSGDGAELGYGDYYRQHSLWARQAVDSQARLIGLFDMMAKCGAPYPADMRADAVRMRQTMGQVADVMAAQALAYDEMMAAGGPDNSRAWVEYEAMTRRHSELLPREHGTE